MSSVRNKAVRKKKVGRKVTKKVLTGHLEVSDADKLRIISALYIVVFNSAESLIPQATELYHVLGDILEGRPLEDLHIRTIDYATFLQAYDDLAHD